MSDPFAHAHWRPWHMEPLGADQPPVADAGAARRELARKRAFEQRLALQQLREQTEAQAREVGHAEGREQGYAQGLEEGRKAAAEELRQQLEQTLAPLRALCRSFDQALQAVDGQVASQLGRVAIDLAGRLAGQALAVQPAQVEVLVRQMLACEPALSGKPGLGLNPNDLPWVQGCLGDELAAAGWHLQADPSILPGGCRLLSTAGELDATRQARQDLFERNAQWLLERAAAEPGSV
ncbi:flagellar assembly protein FliH [Pantoea sp. Tr-811]|uniref:flagellar assembly protein FliH n=1 Tax=Pantoea sp. Tr-811 TaxID=2608361 RepID=UPI0019631D49|nr:flagellar assembly protein FliH [Pantoea sp. Tr-811]